MGFLIEIALVEWVTLNTSQSIYVSFLIEVALVKWATLNTTKAPIITTCKALGKLAVAIKVELVGALVIVIDPYGY